MESQILIRGFRSVKSSSIYRILAAVPSVCPTVPGNKAPWSVGVSLKSGMSDQLSHQSGQTSERTTQLYWPEEISPSPNAEPKGWFSPPFSSG